MSEYEETILAILEAIQAEQHKTMERLERLERETGAVADEHVEMKKNIAQISSITMGMEKALSEVFNSTTYLARRRVVTEQAMRDMTVVIKENVIDIMRLSAAR